MQNDEFDLDREQTSTPSRALHTSGRGSGDLERILPVTARVVQEFRFRHRSYVLVDKCVVEPANGRVHLLEFAPESLYDDCGMLAAYVAGRRIYMTDEFAACGIATPGWAPTPPGRTQLAELRGQFSTLAALSFKTLEKVRRLQ